MRNFKGLFSKAMELLRQFDSYRTSLYYRGPNNLADRLADQGIDQTLRQAKVDQAIAPRNLKLSRGGKSGLHRTRWPLTAAPSDRGKVPQKTYRPSNGG
jgi:hypothetical protein